MVFAGGRPPLGPSTLLGLERFLATLATLSALRVRPRPPAGRHRDAHRQLPLIAPPPGPNQELASLSGVIASVALVAAYGVSY
jgi:hypothetical protein